DNIQYNGQTELQISQMDSAKFSQFTKGINKGKPLSREEYKSFVEKQKDVVFFESDNNYKSVAEFDSLNLRGEIKKSWMDKLIIRKQLEAKNEYNNQDDYAKALWNSLS